MLALSRLCINKYHGILLLGICFYKMNQFCFDIKLYFLIYSLCLLRLVQQLGTIFQVYYQIIDKESVLTALACAVQMYLASALKHMHIGDHHLGDKIETKFAMKRDALDPSSFTRREVHSVLSEDNDLVSAAEIIKGTKL